MANSSDGFEVFKTFVVVAMVIQLFLTFISTSMVEDDRVYPFQYFHAVFLCDKVNSTVKYLDQDLVNDDLVCENGMSFQNFMDSYSKAAPDD